MGIYLPGKELKLVLESVTPEMHRLFQHEHFGCTKELSSAYSDGHFHFIPPWRALGHRLYTGSPKFNHACYAVVIEKIGEHIGEKIYGTAEYAALKAAGGRKWPQETYRDSTYYLEAGLIDSGYVGGILGGSMTSAVMAASVPTVSRYIGNTVTDYFVEVVHSDRIASARADASRRHAHGDS